MRSLAKEKTMLSQLRNHSVIKALALSVMVSLGVTACTTSQGNQKQQAGSLLGGALGAVIGSQFGEGSGRDYAIAAGAILGALAGSNIGAQLDERDRLLAGQAQSKALNRADVNETISWNNPNSGNSGTYTPTRNGTSSSGQYCREYKQEIIIDGRRETGYGTACQRSDGSWEII